MFSIDCLEILNGCEESLRKNLEIGKYPFNDRYGKETDGSESFIERTPDFFGRHINIQAIVGKNGSGKSTLMDLMYMAINNFAYMFDRNSDRLCTSILFFVKGLYVNVYYSVDSQRFVLSCRGEVVELQGCDDGVVRRFGVTNNPERRKSIADLAKIVSPFFYTIVSNYSLQSFVSSNYITDVYAYNKTLNKSTAPNEVNSKGFDGSIRDGEPLIQPVSWIDSIFHKNDGYICPIVLNPFRSKGIINMEKEKSLSKARLIALLIDGKKNNRNVFPEYDLEKIEYELNEQYVLDKFPGFKSIEDVAHYLNPPTIEEEQQISESYRHLSDLYRLVSYTEDYCFSKVALCATLYIAYKIDKIVYQYPTYEKYRAGNEKTLYDYTDANYYLFKSEVEAAHSHECSKLKQTFRLLDYIKKIKELKKGKYSRLMGRIVAANEKFNYDEYCKKMKNTFFSLDEIIDELPPPFFSYEVYLKDSFNVDDAPVKLSLLSSGESQLLQTLAVHAYHVRNILSISNKNRVQYKCLNLVFDEMEICFHPEYQRKFVNTLVNMLIILSKENVFFNVFIITHSPFVLSDIPNGQILYLENGHRVSEKEEKKTFAGNIGEMFYELMFMEKTVGEFAAKKLEENIKRLDNEGNPVVKNTQEYEKIRTMFDLVSDKILRCLLLDKLERMAK